MGGKDTLRLGDRSLCFRFEYVFVSNIILITLNLSLIIVSNSFLLLLVRPLLLVAMHLFLVASCFYLQTVIL